MLLSSSSSCYQMSEAEKTPYNKMADEDKQRYEREKAAVGV